MKIREWISQARLALANSSSPELDAELIIGKVLRVDKAALLLMMEKELPVEKVAEANRLQELRENRTPMAYILGSQSFKDLDIRVTSEVLIPRPTTEAIVDATIEVAHKIDAQEIYEIGTGSGVIAIAIAKALPGVRIMASDISKEALEVAQQNVTNFGLENQITLVHSNLGEHIKNARLLVANLPYLPVGLEVSPDVEQEPAIALWSGKDGLDHYRELISSTTFDVAVLEIGADQYETLSSWINTNLPGYKIEPVLDIDGNICGLIAGKVEVLAD